jgi:hypothetical protein
MRLSIYSHTRFGDLFCVAVNANKLESRLKNPSAILLMAYGVES